MISPISGIRKDFLPYAYTIFEDEGIFKARDTNGEIRFEDPDIKTLFDQVIANAKEGEAILVKESVKATYSGSINITKALTIVFRKGSKLTHSGTGPAIKIYGTVTSYLDKVRFIGAHIEGNAGLEEDGLAISYVKNSVVEDCFIEKTGEEGIAAVSVVNLVLRHNQILECGQQSQPGIEIRGLTGEECKDNVVENNYIERTWYDAGIVAVDASKVLIQNNFIREPAYKATSEDPYKTSGILVHTPTLDVQDVEIRENFIIDSQFIGISVVPAGGNTLKRILVKDNIIVGSGSRGIYFAGGASNQFASVEGNYAIESAKQGIFFSTQYSSLISNVVIDSGTAQAADEHNIYIYQCIESIIADNISLVTVSGKVRYLLYLITSSSRNIVANNSLYRPDTQQVGLRLTSDCDNNLIIGNKVNGGWWNIEISSPDCDDNFVMGNVIAGTRKFINDSGTNTLVRLNSGYKTENSGIVEISGTGVDNDFLIGAHGLARRPSDPSEIFAEGTPASTDAINASPCEVYASDEDADGNYESLRVRFASNPISGTNNVVVRWKAELYS